jgi:hypothetical protein
MPKSCENKFLDSLTCLTFVFKYVFFKYKYNFSVFIYNVIINYTTILAPLYYLLIRY